MINHTSQRFHLAHGCVEASTIEEAKERAVDKANNWARRFEKHARPKKFEFRMGDHPYLLVQMVVELEQVLHVFVLEVYMVVHETREEEGGISNDC